MTDPTRRFSSRVDNYIQYRPTYPPQIIDALRSECGLSRDSVVADIGSGTGILTRLFLQQGNPVIGVEPNQEMRQAAERLLSNHPKFISVDGTAEATTLDRDSVDIITAGQSFHWFKPDLAQQEWSRILRAGGWAILIWNERRSSGTPFLEAYEQLLQRYGQDYRAVGHKNLDLERIRTFFEGGRVTQRQFQNRQRFDFSGLQGRLLSSSYTPDAGHSNYQPMLRHLKTIFEATAVDGQVTFEYDTNIFYGHLPA